MRHRNHSSRFARPLRGLLASGAAVLTGLALLAPATAAPPASDNFTANPPADVEVSAKITHTITHPDGSDAEAIENRWFVELASPAVADGGDAAAVAAEQKQLAAAIRDAGIDAEVTTEYGTLWNGVAVSVDDAAVESLAQLDEVVSLQPVVRIPQPDEDLAADSRTAAEQAEGLLTPQMSSALGLTGADIAQSELGYTGDGVNIGIIDSGVDYDHTELGGTGSAGTPATEGDGSSSFPNAKVTAGFDFVGDAYGDPAVAAQDLQAAYTPVPDAYPDDCSGHGTHVAGIAAAHGTAGTDEVTGVAPDAEIGAYRVFGCQGSSDAEVIAVAMQRAAEDGMDIVNLSISADYMVTSDYPITASAESLAARGIVVTAAQGNAGESGRWSLGAPAAGAHVLSAGSVDNTIAESYYLAVSSQSSGTEVRYLYSLAEGGATSVVRDDDAHYPLVAAGDPAADGGDETTDASLLCQPVSADAFSGAVVLVRRGGCSFYDKAANAEAAGAVAVIFDNNAAGAFGVTLTGGASTITIPAVAISQEDGDAIRVSLADDSQLAFSEESAEFNIATGGEVSSFSAWGLSEDLSLKPDVVAPGGYIWSTWPLEEGGYQSVSGTSMSAPYLAGAAALILQSHPEIKTAGGVDVVEDISWRLRSTATPLAWAGSEDAGLLEPVAHQGAGLIDVDAAIRATTRTSASVLNLGESEHYPDGNTQEVTLTNQGAEAVTYALSHTDAVTVTGASPTPQQGTTTPASVSTDGTSVTVPAGGTTTLSVTITAPADAADGDFYGGWVVLTPTDGATGQADGTVRIPYSGIAGNLAAAQVFGDATAVVDLDAKPVDTGSYVFGDSTRTTEGAYEDLPAVLIEPLIPYRGSVLEVSRVYNDGTVTYLGPATYDASAYVRGQRPYFVWYGGYLDANGDVQQAPTGDYQLTVRVCPAGDDCADAADWAVWNSPEIAIDWKTDGYLPQSSLAATAPEGADAAVDDNIFTTDAESSGQADYVLDLGATYDVTKIHYTPDQTADAAHATELTAYVSADGENWEQAGSAQIDATRWAPTILELDQSVRGRYVRVELTNTSTGESNGVSVAELRVAGEETAAPDPTAEPTAAPTAAPTGETTAGPSTPSSAPSTDTGGGGAPSSGPTGSSGGGVDSVTSQTQAAAATSVHSLARTGAYTALILVAASLVVGGCVLLLLRRRYR
ncbi:S8 family serine peptidase [Actinomyces sp. MRS3W]|uniref:S8 family serine peptidase n=1 Tax=Actinomyces sp. MRS3W TaxID=2800796 RepID=UPI0028FD7188|nr:S8 family serine peptidase [Actinomyces sp. MRS3W]MDU0347879.1 S8 family serine peptidase [Actinomyces sp. MRS3W]